MFSNPFKRAPEPEPSKPVFEEVALPDAAQAQTPPVFDQIRLPPRVAEPVSSPVESEIAPPEIVVVTENAAPENVEPQVGATFGVAPEMAVAEVAAPAETTVPEPVLVKAPVTAGELVVKPLFVGAFLNGELEVVEVLERGPINFYRANAGGWGENDWKWVWERAAFGAEPVESPADPFFAPATRFVQDEREYAVYDFDERDSFLNWRSPANDDTFLQLIARVAHGLERLENAALNPNIAPDSLWFEDGQLRAFGFFDAKSDGELSALHALAAWSCDLAKAHLAPRATLRLDDVWAALPFSVELKTWARALESRAFASISEARAALAVFALPTHTQIQVQTDVGLERDHNEDGVLSLSLGRAGQNGAVSLELLAVADGMGGHEAGEVASQTALDTLQNAILKRQNANWNDNFEALSLGRELIGEVNAAVISQNEAPPFSSMRHKPGTTLVFCVRLGRRLLMGNVGDSRLYRWSDARGLELLTKDHSYVQDLLDQGKISPDEAWDHPDGSIITSHIGMSRGLLSDVSLRLVSKSERVVLVSDGVVDTLRDAQIEEVVASASDAASLCSNLVNAANQAGGIDNISVAAMFCE